jgi:hypothetical protein
MGMGFFRLFHSILYIYGLHCSSTVATPNPISNPQIWYAKIPKDDLAHIEALEETSPDVFDSNDSVVKYKDYVVIKLIHNDGIYSKVCQIKGINNTSPFTLQSDENHKWQEDNLVAISDDKVKCDYYSRTGQHAL